MPEVVARTRGRARLIIVGHSVLRPRFEAAVPAAVRDHVHFVGRVPSADLPRWYATGDIFVSPATGGESFGIVLVEAMASGKPVVASDIPGYRCVVSPDRNGLLAPPGDPERLAHALASLALDPARQAELARRGRERALEFAWPRGADQIETLYRGDLRGARQSQAGAALWLSAGGPAHDHDRGRELPGLPRRGHGPGLDGAHARPSGALGDRDPRGRGRPRGLHAASVPGVGG